MDKKKPPFLHFFRYSNLILNLFSLMVDANIPDIALEPDKTVKKVRLLLLERNKCFFQWSLDFTPN